MLPQQPLVSIVTPSYNRCHTLPRLWRSLECQSLPQFEWIVVDDCSTDDTEALMNSPTEQDQRIRYIKHPVNRGVNVARQTGAEQARADFLVFVDSDDMIYDANTLEAMYQEIVRAPSNVGEVCFVSVFADGTPAAHVPEDRLILGYVDLICGNRVRGEFLGICRREFVQRVPFSTYRLFESVHNYERARYFLMMIINMAAYPLVVTALEQSGAEAARLQLARNLRLLLAASVPAALGMILFAPQVASLVLGKSFRQAGIVIIPWIAAATLLAGVRSYYFDLAFQLGKQTIGQLWVVGSSAVVNFVLNVALIPRAGIVGAAWATIAAYAVALLLSVLLGRRAFTVPMSWRGAGQVLLAAAAMVACWYIVPAGQTLWSSAGQVVCVVFIYCTTLFLLHTHWRHRFPFATGGRRE